MSWDKSLARKFFEGKKALIVDQSQTAGRSLRKLLAGYGVSPDLIFVSSQFEEAKKLISKLQPHLLICDADLGKESGLELIQQHIETLPNRIEGTCILMSPESSNANLGNLAEAQVDSILLKPYTLQTFDECLSSAFSEKLNPPDYLVLFEKAKQEFRERLIKPAFATAEEALNQNPKFTPLYALAAQINLSLNEVETAAGFLRKGLQVDAQSFLCMNGLFELYMSQKNHDLAYETAALMHEKYPPSANRLLELVKLSIYCSKFEDIISYCNHFKALNTPQNSLNRAIIAALLICSKYFRSKERGSLATEVLKDASRISGRTELLQPEVFRYLIDNGDFELADGFFSQMTKENREKAEVILLRMELLLQFGDHAQLITLGQNLVKEKLDTLRTYELMIEASRKMNRSEQVIQNLILESEARHGQTPRSQ
jgi:DNA-binding NarL/FixJ family response regulator